MLFQIVDLSGINRIKQQDGVGPKWVLYAKWSRFAAVEIPV